MPHPAPTAPTLFPNSTALISHLPWGHRGLGHKRRQGALTLRGLATPGSDTPTPPCLSLVPGGYSNVLIKMGQKLETGSDGG